MLTKRIIACLDVRDGRGVKGVQFVDIVDAGDPAELLMLDPRTGMKRLAVLGPKVMEGQEPQVAVPGGVWQGARIKPDPAAVRGWTLFSCTLAPAWDPSDFELGRTASLLEAFPSEARWIRALTRG